MATAGILGPAVYDRHVLALNIAGVFEALAKSAHTVRQSIRRPAVEEPDHRHRRLLRPRRERPGGRRAADPPGPSFASDKKVALHAVAGHIAALRDFNPGYVG
jgi:hypothetical protein